MANIRTGDPPGTLHGTSVQADTGSPGPLMTYGSLSQTVENLSQPGIAGIEALLPGVVLKSFTLHRDKDHLGDASEIYMFGVAIDGTLDEHGNCRVRVIPFGEVELAAQTNQWVPRFQRLRAGQTITYHGRGLLLVPPPVSQFLMLRLWLADGDRGARKSAELVQRFAEVVGSAEMTAALTAAGMPPSAAAAFVFGQALKAGAVALKENHDDVADAFEGYFDYTNMQADEQVTLNGPGASVVLEFVDFGDEAHAGLKREPQNGGSQ